MKYKNHVLERFTKCFFSIFAEVVLQLQNTRKKGSRPKSTVSEKDFARYIIWPNS